MRMSPLLIVGLISCAVGCGEAALAPLRPDKATNVSLVLKALDATNSEVTAQPSELLQLKGTGVIGDAYAAVPDPMAMQGPQGSVSGPQGAATLPRPKGEPMTMRCYIRSISQKIPDACTTVLGGLNPTTKSFEFAGIAHAPQEPGEYTLTISIFEPAYKRRDPLAPGLPLGPEFPIARYDLVVVDDEPVQR